MSTPPPPSTTARGAAVVDSVDPGFAAGLALGLEVLASTARSGSAAAELRQQAERARRTFVERRLIALHPERRRQLAGVRGDDLAWLLAEPFGEWLAVVAEQDLGPFVEPAAAWIDRNAVGALRARGARLLSASLAGAPASVRARAAASVGPEYAEQLSGGGTLVVLGPGLAAERERAQALVARASGLLGPRAEASGPDRLMVLGLLGLAHGVSLDGPRLTSADWRALRWRLPGWVDALWSRLTGGEDA